jgi:hypothetical protein
MPLPYELRSYEHRMAMVGGSLVTTPWRILRLRMEGSPPVTEGNCENIE